MPRVALDVFEVGETTISDGTHPPVPFGQLRIFVWVKLGGEYAARQAVLDTGASCTVLSKHIWTELDRRKAITWLTHPPGHDAELPVLQIVGGRYGFRLGRVDIQVSSLAGAELRPVPVLVQCVEDGEGGGQEPLKVRAILGLSGGLRHGRTFTLEADAAGARWAAALAGP